MALEQASLQHALLDAQVMHARHAPKKHVLHYRVWYLCFDVQALPLVRGLKWVSAKGFNLFQLRDRDYGAGQHSLPDWIVSIKAQYGVSADGPTTLLTMPRVLGYGFNPVSFWFMQDAAGNLRAVLAEVNNTFGERHCYLCRHADGRPILPSDWLRADKVFHVSPFMQVNGAYDFRFYLQDSAVEVFINHSDPAGQRLLTTSLKGQRRALNNKSLLGAFFRYPLVTFRVIALIHWHALRLVLKGVKYNRKPIPPTHMVSE